MAFEVTATRRRPQTFEDMAGQDFFVSTISNAIKQKRIAHAYLFSGPRGVGKTSSARILAKALNCEQGPTAHPCGVCSNCKEITAGNSTDVIEIDGASNTSVNDIRAIKDEVMFPPQKCRYKIYIIDEVHMLSTSAFNALLKTIEEPPEYIIFIFATTETQKVPATIRSRCQQFHFRLFTMETIVKLLTEAAAETDVQADHDALLWIARESTGSMRDAYTLFDQIVSFSHGHITLASIQDKLGVSGVESLNNVVLSIQEGTTARTDDFLSELLSSGVSVEQCVRDFASFFRMILLLRHGVTSVDALGMRPDAIPKAIVDSYTDEQAEAALEMFLQVYRDIRYSVNPKFELELAVSRLAQLPYTASSHAVMQSLSAMKRELLGLAGIQPSQEPIAATTGKAGKTSPTDGQERLVIERPWEKKTQTAPPPRQNQTPPPESSPLEPSPFESSQPVSKTSEKQERQRETMDSDDVTHVTQPLASPQYSEPLPATEKAKASPSLPRPFTKDDFPALVDAFERAKNPTRLNLTYLTDAYEKNNSLVLEFATRFSADSISKVIPFLRSAIRSICGYDGPVEIMMRRQEQKEDLPTQIGLDPIDQKIARMFNGKTETVHQIELAHGEKDDAQ
ncbi:DNA polymerase III subunit gamma/tau [Parasphaerochaeta coccoides]|uniref:DNA polymerase III subunit gamma/tau n=1 Tax=Parasphaerochaeta coccoides (strain ATCC BAA-1237 / DSM 17374 / SPN1) TaxID=760011 RepID=F4GLZ7_PARC1|nr:DNA polymerase III subunit gamma/tau [Parasphaerochaeta coccoides]AEC03038.1 DNA polymerase III, subunits gamma and tau [Parasphaerochaeta coccoides DSM 17374]